MEYYAKIQDVDNLEDELLLEFGARGTFSLNWLGGDDKTQPIVGSEFNFSLHAEDCEELKYDKYFTSDEQKWLTSVYRSDNDELIWKGYLLPESYSEPYKQGLKFINFSAVDGLGLLKGKTLPDEFYRDEKLVTDIIGKCLDLTGLINDIEGFYILISPAIKNTNEEEWKGIFLDTSKYYDEDELPSAYEVLEDIIISMRCQLFQCDGKFYVEGINKRFLTRVEYEGYGDYTAGHSQYKGRYTVEKNIKQLEWLTTPNITLIAPYNSVTTSHEAAKLEMPDEVYRLSDPPFEANKNSNDILYYSHYWDGNDGYTPDVDARDDFIVLPKISSSDEFNDQRKITLRNKPWAEKGWRINIKLEIEVVTVPTNPPDSLVEKWIDYAVYRISVGDAIYFFNLNSTETDLERLVFDKGGTANVDLFFTVKESGYFNVEFFEPYKNYNDVNISAYKIKSLEVNTENQPENFVFTSQGIEDASQKQEIELPISGDISGYSKSFYLERTRDFTNEITNIERDTYRTFTQNGVNYAVIDILTAYLIDQFKSVIGSVQVFNSNNTYNITGNVTYNFEGSEMHVVEIGNIITDPKIRVRYRKYRTVIDRQSWEQWSDDIYKVESKKYGQVVAEIEQKLFSIPYIKIDGSAWSPVKFNDIIRFRYDGIDRYFYPSNCQWTPDDRSSSVILHEGIYNGARYGSLPPYVDAGEDLLLNNSGALFATAHAIAFDPDGTIENIEWTQIEGPPANILGGDTLNPTFTNLTDDHYVFQIEVTDNVGNVATDTVEVNRVLNSDLLLENTIPLDFVYPVPGTTQQYTLHSQYKLTNSPDFLDEYSINIFFDLLFEMNTFLGGYSYQIVINKNDQLYTYTITDGFQPPTIYDVLHHKNKKFSETFNFQKGDVFFIDFYASGFSFEPLEPGAIRELLGLLTFRITSYDKTNGYQEITNIPAEKGYYITDKKDSGLTVVYELPQDYPLP